jgi:hypothetical protein
MASRYFLGALLGFANRITQDVSHNFLSISLVPLVLLKVNVSMFTTLASGGGLLILLIKRLWKEISPETPHRQPPTKAEVAIVVPSLHSTGHSSKDQTPDYNQQSHLQ